MASARIGVIGIKKSVAEGMVGTRDIGHSGTVGSIREWSTDKLLVEAVIYTATGFATVELIGAYDRALCENRLEGGIISPTANAVPTIYGIKRIECLTNARAAANTC